ncbi:hypothetical protein HanPSC8_Chr17g0796261 [Helianthus annuus]|nr:hypothetical protein HanPSC8_Chr17g0796261 [Helianthus annuus]
MVGLGYPAPATIHGRMASSLQKSKKLCLFSSRPHRSIRALVILKTDIAF